MPTGRVPGVRGRARTRPGWVRSPFSTSIALYPISCSSICMQMSLSLLICSTSSSRSCSTSGTSHHGRKMQEGSFTRTIGTSTRNSRRSLTMHGLECVGSFVLPFILLSFHFIYFNIYFFILRYFNLTLFSISLTCQSIHLR